MYRRVSAFPSGYRAGLPLLFPNSASAGTDASLATSTTALPRIKLWSATPSRALFSQRTQQRCSTRTSKESMPTLDFLPSIRDSETITCPRCRTRQYPRSGTCVRCRRPLGLEYLVVPIDGLLSCCAGDHHEQVARTIGFMLRNLRKRRHICQSQLAAMAGGMNRSRLSKAECGHVLLPLSRLLPLARALGLSSVILRFETINPGPEADSKRIR